MKKFSKVQFIGVALCTTPAMLTSIEETSDDGYYAGFKNDKTDITERIGVIKDFIKTAIDTNKIENNSKILKVFVIPEFFFRGVLGAYHTTEYSTKTIPTHVFLINEFCKAIDELKLNGYKIDSDYLFILGTALFTYHDVNYNTEPTKSLYESGDNLLDIYYRLHPKQTDKIVCTPSIKKMSDYLKILDGKDFLNNNTLMEANESNSDNAFIDVLIKTLNYCDTQAKIEIYNRCLIFAGAAQIIKEPQADELPSPTRDPFVVQKQFKSKEDFILNSKNNDKVCDLPKYLQTITKYPDIDNQSSDRKVSLDDGRAIFEYEGVNIGVDICLDHSRQRLVKHLYKHPNDLVDIQIVTSCGMDVREKAVIARKNGYVFNCDGEYEFSNDSKGVNGNCSHTSLQKIADNIIISDNKILKEAALESAMKPIENKEFIIPDDKSLFRFSDCNIHIYPSVEL